MILTPRPLSALPRRDTLDALLHGTGEGVFFPDGQRPGRQVQYLQDLGPAPYVARLQDVLLVPAGAFGPGLRAGMRLLRRGVGWSSAGTLPEGLSHAQAHLLIGRGGAILADSLALGCNVPLRMEARPDGTWTAPAVTATATVDRALYVEAVAGQFGHALVDMPARAWPLARSDLAALGHLPGIGLATHGLRAGRQDLPEATRRILAAIGVDPDHLILTGEPTLVRDLIVPRRISPHLGPGGAPYNALMQAAGRRLAPDDMTGANPRLFLSRSRLSGANRQMDPAAAEAIDAIFARAGFDVFHPQNHDLAVQVARVRAARQVAGVVGSQLHLTAFAENRGLRMFRIVPGFFAPPIDHAILRPLGGVVTDHVVPARKPLLTRPHRAGWHMDRAELDRLAAAVAEWAGRDHEAR